MVGFGGEQVERVLLRASGKAEPEEAAREIVRACLQHVVRALLSPAVVLDGGDATAVLESEPMRVAVGLAVERRLVALQKPEAPVQYSVLRRDVVVGGEPRIVIAVTARMAL